MEFFIDGGGVSVKVTVQENMDGTLSFNFHVVQPDEEGYLGQIGELNGVFFDLLGDQENSTFTAVTDDGTPLDLTSGEESVSNLGGGINMNGEVIKEDGAYDVGIVTDETGLGNGDTQDITFTLSADYPLTLADIEGMDFGLRLTSVGDPEGERDGSLKLSGTADPEEPPVDDEPPGDEPPADDPTGTNDALDDLIFADEDQLFDGFAEAFQIGGPTTILANDVTDNPDGTTSAYEGQVVESEGVTMEGEDFIIVPGSNGGLLKIYPDGTVDFSANGEFDALNDTETADTEFSYMIEGGDMATVTVRVFGFDGGGEEEMMEEAFF